MMVIYGTDLKIQKGKTNRSICIRPATLLKKRLWHSWFPVNFAKFLKTLFLTLILVGFLGFSFEMGGRGDKITPA